MVKPISVYDNRTRKRLAYLENAYDISYNKSTNSIWTAEFSLPFSDPKTRHCQAFNYVELWEEDGTFQPQYVGLFRIMPRTEEMLGTEANIVYQLEHVLSTLLDDVMIGYHEIGNKGVYTTQVLGYILDKQIEKKWILGKCEYDHQFLYGWQDENLLSALFSVVQPFEETDYYWSFNTKNYPWTLDLRKTNKVPVTDIRYRKNLNGLTRTVDPTNLTTRLYCYGYGQGDNKLGISEINDGVPYLDSPNISKYGVITQVWTDERFTVAESLKEVGENMLRRLEKPAVSYEIDVQSIQGTSSLQIGDTVRMVSSGLDEIMTVREISKDDVTGQPQAGNILLGDATIDVSTSIAELADRQRIAETYSQGAESIFTDSFVDNADQNNPAEVVFTIPDNVVHVNEIRFSCQLTPFRAYSRAIQGGGSGVTTTEDGGGTTPTTSSGGGFTPTSSSGGGATPTSSSRGGSRVTSYSNNTYSNSTSTRQQESKTTGSSGVDVQQGWVYTQTPGEDHEHRYWHVTGHRHTFDIPSHSHSFTVPSHRHDVQIDSHDHTVRIDPHTHTVKIDPHTHTVTVVPHKHKMTIPNHVHGIEYGIYRGPRATKYTVYLDDKKIGDYTGNISNLNLIDYMSKNTNGNIMRGKHTIRITPNNLTRIECTFQIRLFTNMHGGKQY